MVVSGKDAGAPSLQQSGPQTSRGASRIATRRIAPADAPRYPDTRLEGLTLSVGGDNQHARRLHAGLRFVGHGLQEKSAQAGRPLLRRPSRGQRAGRL